MNPDLRASTCSGIPGSEPNDHRPPGHQGAHHAVRDQSVRHPVLLEEWAWRMSLARSLEAEHEPAPGGVASDEVVGLATPSRMRKAQQRSRSRGLQLEDDPRA